MALKRISIVAAFLCTSLMLPSDVRRKRAAERRNTEFMTYLKACSDKRRLGGELVQAARERGRRQRTVSANKRTHAGALHLLTEAADTYAAAEAAREKLIKHRRDCGC